MLSLDISSCVAVDDRGYPSSWDYINDSENSSYLELYVQSMGGCKKKEDLYSYVFKRVYEEIGVIEASEKIGWEYNRAECCGKTFLGHEVIETNDTGEYEMWDKLYQRIRCGKAMCPECGVKGGAKHQKRKKTMRKRIFEKYEKDKLALRIFVFTVPENLRCEFESRERINLLIKIVNEIVKKFFPGKDFITDFHPYGDNEPGVYKPHVNVIMCDDRNQVLKLDLEVLRDIRTEYKNTLEGLFYESIDEVNIYYSFKKTEKAIGHAIKYFSRPVPSKEDIEKMPFEFRYMFLVEMKGFQYIRWSKSWGKVECETERYLQGNLPAGVKLRCLGFVGQMSDYNPETLYKENERRVLKDGLIHCRYGGFEKKEESKETLKFGPKKLLPGPRNYKGSIDGQVCIDFDDKKK